MTPTISDLATMGTQSTEVVRIPAFSSTAMLKRGSFCASLMFTFSPVNAQ